MGIFEVGDTNVHINYNNRPLNAEESKRPLLYNMDSTNSSLPQWAIAAPLYTQVVDWFKTKYFIDIHVKHVCTVNEILDSYGIINFMINEFSNPDIRVESEKITDNMMDKTIEKVIDIINPKDKKEILEILTSPVEGVDLIKDDGKEQR